MLMSLSQPPPACCSALAGLSPELSLSPAAVETTHQLLLAETQPALVLLERHCVTGLPAGGECVWGMCVGSVSGESVWEVCGECVWGVCVECGESVRGGCAGSVCGESVWGVCVGRVCGECV